MTHLSTQITLVVFGIACCLIAGAVKNRKARGKVIALGLLAIGSGLYYPNNPLMFTVNNMF